MPNRENKHPDPPQRERFPLIEGLLKIYNKVVNVFKLGKDILNVLLAFKDEALRHLHEILKFISQINHELREIKRRLDALETQQPRNQFNYDVRIKLMPRVIKADHVDFDIPVTVNATDSEGNPVKGGGLPAGFTLTLTSDNDAAFSVTPDPSNPLNFKAHVGGPNPDGNPNLASLTATLNDANGVLVATDAEAIVVTAGDPSAISGINIVFPDDIPDTPPAEPGLRATSRRNR